MLKKYGIILLTLCLALFTAACAKEPEPAPATENVDEIAFTLTGEGTEESPYLIATKEDLLQFAAVMNHEKQYYDYMNGYFRLTADIALNDCSDVAAWSENAPETVWMPIAYYHSFKGVFDGNGHTISGLYMDQSVTKYEYDGYSRELDRFGLFGYLDGEIKNLTVENAYVHPKKVDGENPPDAGILAGSNSGTISGCAVEGIVVCEGSYFGGIAGSNHGIIAGCTFTGELREVSATYIGGIAGSGGNIRNCTVSAQMICENTEESLLCASMGGIAGIHSGFSQDAVIESCTFNGEILSGHYAGGIVGHAAAASFEGNGAKTVIRGCANNGSVAAAEDAGGIVGFAMSSYETGELWVDGCSNSGLVRSQSTDTCAAGGIVGHIDTRKDGPVVITECRNEAELRAAKPGGIVGWVMQSAGNIRIEKCTNAGAIQGEGSYAGGILCHIQQWGDGWNICIDQCVNEGNIITQGNAGGIVCFAYDADANGADRAMTISNCVNRGDLSSGGINNYMGGILGVNALAKAPVRITGCINEGDLSYTGEVVVDAETLSGELITLSRTSGGIVGYVGTAPYLTLNSGARTLDNIHVEEAFLNIENCSSTGKFFHEEARFAADVSEAMLENLKKAGYENVLNFFIALEGGIVGTVADQENYSVYISGCSYTNVEREMDDWNRFPTGSQ